MEIQNASEEIKIKGVADLLRESWQIYRSKIKTLLGIMSVLIGFNIFSDILISLLSGTDLKYSVLFSIVLAIFSLVSLFLLLWTIPSLIFAIKEDIGIKESYRKGFRKLISYIWVYFLLSALILGVLVAPSILVGFIMISFSSITQAWPTLWPFLILIDIILIILGVLFIIWFSLSFFTLLFEEKQGINALLKSKFLVSGNFWRFLWRYLVLLIIIFIVPLAILFLLDKISSPESTIVLIKDIVRDAVNYSLEFFTIPFAMIYGYLIYNNLVEIKREIPYQKSALSGKFKYVLPGILGALVVGSMVLIWFLNIVWGRDERSPDDNDLRLSKIEIISETDNAFYWLSPWIFNTTDSSGKSMEDEMISKYWPEGRERLREKKELYLPSDKTKIVDDMITGKSWDNGLAQELMEKNKEMFDDFDRAVSSPYFQDPIFKNPDNINPFTPLFHIGQYRNIAKLNIIKSSYLFKQGKEKEAFDEAIKLVRFGSLVKNSQGTMLEYLVATATNEMGLNQIRAMISIINLTSEDLKNYISKLEGLRDNGQGLIKIMKGEYAFSSYYKKATDMLYEGKLSKAEYETFGDETKEYSYSEYLRASKAMRKSINYLYKPNQTQRFIIEDTRIRVNNASKEYYKDMNFNEEKGNLVYSQFKSLGPAIIFTENPIGKILYSIGSVSLSGAFRKKIHENFSAVGTQALIALKAFKIDNGRLPNSLYELVPVYLSEIPKDPFDGKLIRYSKENKIIYSVGPDLKDSNGKSNIEVGSGKPDDISYEINF